MNIKLINSECIKAIKEMDDNSVDAVITDPPYEIGFMGKKWDSTGIAYSTELWEEALRVLKPGGHLLSFSAARTYHRMAVAIEDAGFEIRDMIEWVYGSGFPKSHDISKAIDKKLGKEREIIGEIDKIQSYGHKGNNTYGGDVDRNGKMVITAPASPEAQQYQGWGTALKPAHEPIVLARKPLTEKTIAENVMEWGTGGINIDESRIDYNGETPNIGGRAKHTRGDGYGFKALEDDIKPNTQGRFPANFIIGTDVAPVLDEQSGISKKGNGKLGYGKNQGSSNINYGGGIETTRYPGEGGASRYFKNIEEEPPFYYCPKASKKERGDGNNHPTVKPVKLMEYLINLITPEGGVVLDPFMGSGSTGVACVRAGKDFIGIEMEAEYIGIAKKRIEKEREAK